MTRIFRKILSLLLCLFCLLLGLTAVIYLLVVHPNDQRVEPPKVSQLSTPTTFVTKVGSILLSGYDHHLMGADNSFKAAKDRLSKEIKEYATLNSKRFVSPYQVYLPIGNYPWRLEGRDGLLIPAGDQLVVSPKLTGDMRLEVAAISLFDKGKVTIELDGKPLGVLELSPVKVEREVHGAFGNAMRYISVDRGPAASRWQEQSFPVTLADAAKLSLKCESANGFCIVGDPTFYTASKDAPKSYLVILVDTLRGDALSGGNAPAMNRLATSGVQFKRALAPGNMTSPSTNSILACRKASDLGPMAFAYSVSLAHREKFYAEKKPSFPAIFNQGLYDTAMIGNVSVVSEVFGVGVDHGFARQISIETEAYDTAQIEREAVEWLGQHADRPFLLYVHFNGPHAPYRAPLRDLMSVFPGFRHLNSYAQILSWLYQGEVRYSDRYVDKLLDAVDRLGLTPRTTVVLTADHGDQQTTHIFSDNEVAPSFTGAYFDHGATLLNDEINVPLVFRIPDREKGVEIYDFVSTLGIGPTLLDLSHLGSSNTCGAKSLAPFFDFSSDAVLPVRGAETVGSEGFRGRAVVFADRYKYIRNYAPTDKRIYPPGQWVGHRSLLFNAEELYDLQPDPSESYNLARRNHDLLLKARSVYKDFYQVKSGYELVLEGPVGAIFKIKLDASAALTDLEQDLTMTAKDGALEVVGKLKEQFIIKLSNPGTAPPVVEIAGENIPLRAATLRLPYKIGDELPLESGGEATLLPAAQKANAYLRRVDDANYQERAIATGNPRFEKILREWGYLHDD